MPFLERMAVECVISDKNTLSKNKHPQVGGSGPLLCSLLGSHGQVCS